MRIIMGNLTFYLMVISLKNLPLLITTIVSNTAPLMTVLFGAVLLGERITKQEMGCLLLAFLGIYMLFSEKSATKSTEDSSINVFYLLILLMVPIMVGLQNVLLR